MLEGLAPLVTYCAVMSGTPGPNNVLLATSGANFGYRRTLPHLVGIHAGMFLLTLTVCLGLGTLFAQFPQIHSALKVVGALYLVYLAWLLAGASAGDQVDVARPLTLVEGAAFQLVNPKSWMKAATMASVFMPADLSPLQGALLLSAVGVVVGLPFVTGWALFGVALRRLLHSATWLRAFNALMGLSLLVLAVSLLA